MNAGSSGLIPIGIGFTHRSPFHVLYSVADLGGDPGVQWNPPFGRVLRNYEGFVVVLRVIGALAIVYVTLSLSVLAFAAPITRA